MPNFIEDYWSKNAPLWGNKLVTRFPPEPSGVAHAGHALAAFWNFHLAEKFGGVCHLRMDDTNPEAESAEFAEAIIEGMRWLGFKWEGEVKHASDHFPFIFDLARKLIAEGAAYMDFSDREATRALRGSFVEAGTRSADAEHPPAWHAERFEAMANGELPEGSCALRARIDMASANMNLRDPVLYRIKRAAHHRTGSEWAIYPAYDFAHPACDFAEGTTLSLCTLEFEDHRPFYDWVVAHCARLMPGARDCAPPVELEFARLELDRGITSKRKVKALVESGAVDGWDDPRLVTLGALRRRGFTPTSIRAFCEDAGVSKSNSIKPFSRLEDFLRLDLDERAERRIVVARPIALDIEGGSAPWVTKAPNHPKRPEMGERDFALSTALWIDREDARLAGRTEKGFKRVEPGSVFRVMHGPVLECVAVEANEAGTPARVIARPSEAKPKATIHGLCRTSAVPVELWEPEALSEGADPALSLIARSGFAEPLALRTPGTWHAPRYGYCVRDSKMEGRLILSARLRGSAP